jgi:hypothetical protein
VTAFGQCRSEDFYLILLTFKDESSLIRSDVYGVLLPCGILNDGKLGEALHCCMASSSSVTDSPTENVSLFEECKVIVCSLSISTPPPPILRKILIFHAVF